MEAPFDLKKLITEGIKDLPQSYLTEVADFVLFIRRKAHEQKPFNTEAIQDELRLRALVPQPCYLLLILHSNSPKNDTIHHRYDGYRALSKQAQNAISCQAIIPVG